MLIELLKTNKKESHVTDSQSKQITDKAMKHILI